MNIIMTTISRCDAVAWALENGITNGLADDTFGVNSTCTRAQVVTFLYRAYQGE